MLCDGWMDDGCAWEWLCLNSTSSPTCTHFTSLLPHLGWNFVVSPTPNCRINTKPTFHSTNWRRDFCLDHVSTAAVRSAVLTIFNGVGPSSRCLAEHPMETPPPSPQPLRHPVLPFFFRSFEPFCLAALVLMSINRGSFVFWRRGEE